MPVEGLGWRAHLAALPILWLNELDPSMPVVPMPVITLFPIASKVYGL